MRIGSRFGAAICGLVGACAVAVSPQQQGQSNPAAVLKLQREQTAQLAAAWLHSDDPRLQAWGAYVVLRDHQEQFIPELLAIVNAYDVSDWPAAYWTATDAQQDHHDAMLAVLDAFIQMHAEVPASDAAKIYPEFPAQSLILLSRNGADANRYLLEIFRTEHLQHAAWLAAGNLLVDQKVAGFSAAVLGGMTVHARIVVTTAGRSGAGEGSGMSCSSGGPMDKVGWPEIGTYTLLNCPRERRNGATILANGTDPAYYMRIVGALYKSVPGDCCGFDDPAGFTLDQEREHYLAKMLFAPEVNPPLAYSLSETIVWGNNDVYIAYLRDLAQKEQSAFAEVARKLIDRNLMTAEEGAGVKPQFEIRIFDARDDKSVPLADPGALGENVRVKM